MALFNSKTGKDEFEQQDFPKNKAKKKKKIDLNKEITFKKKNKVKKMEAFKPKSVKLVGIDVGTYDVKVVEGKYKSGKLYISNMFKFTSPEDMYNGGRLANQNMLVLKLRSQMRTEGIRTKNISMVSASSTIINREIVVPYVGEEEELKHLVSYEVQKFLCINLNNYDIQFMIMDDFIEDDIRKLKLFTIIYPKDIIDSYKDLCKKMLVNPYALDISNNAVRKIDNISTIYNSDLITKGKAVLYMDMGYENINLTIVNNGEIEFMRTLPVGGKEIDEYISERKGISLVEADKYKRSSVEVKEQIDDEISTGVCDIIDGWTMDIGRILQFYTNKSRGKKVEAVYLFGGGSKLNGVSNYIEEKLQIPTSRIRTIDSISVDKSIDESTVEEYINAIGSLIRL